MDIIEQTRNLGKEIQKDDRYLAMQIATQSSDEDTLLQEMIGEFNLKRMAINTETAKEDKDEAKLAALNAELRELYAGVMKNENMIAYNKAKEEMDGLLKQINTIIMASAEGGDPDVADVEDGCGDGGCSSCSGCH